MLLVTANMSSECIEERNLPAARPATEPAFHATWELFSLHMRTFHSAVLDRTQPGWITPCIPPLCNNYSDIHRQVLQEMKQNLLIENERTDSPETFSEQEVDFTEEEEEEMIKSEKNEKASYLWQVLRDHVFRPKPKRRRRLNKGNRLRHYNDVEDETRQLRQALYQKYGIIGLRQHIQSAPSQDMARRVKDLSKQFKQTHIRPITAVSSRSAKSRHKIH